MKTSYLTLAALAAIGLLVGCSSSPLPQPGETVSPKLAREIRWSAGAPGEMWVELAAESQNAAARRLGFACSPEQNPVAAISFFDGSGSLLKTEEVELSQRC